MTNSLSRAAEEWFGIKADPDDVKKLQKYLRKTYGGEDAEIFKKVFSSGEAAGFLTVNETYFFREPAHFALLYDLLPSFEKTGMEICSAGGSAGCEAYSIAMMIEAYNKSTGNHLAYHIDAFDVDPNVIETACRGIYGTRALREDGSCFRYMADPYLEKLEDGYRVKSSLKKNIHFFVHNLMDDLPPKEYDIIFFRNAFIYFSYRYREQILSNLSAVLKEGGILFLGVSETAGVHHAGLEEKNCDEVFYFQKSVSGKDSGTDGFCGKTSTQVCVSQEQAKPQKQRKKELYIDFYRVGDVLSYEEKAADIAERIQWVSEDNSLLDGLDGNELVISILYLLKQGNFLGADTVLGYLEMLDDSSITAFLRGEYFFLQDLFTESELYYRISLIKNDAFWPAGYRLCFLSSVEALKKHRVEKALEGLRRGQNLQYEVLIGGFSPDYYTSVLLKQKAG